MSTPVKEECVQDTKWTPIISPTHKIARLAWDAASLIVRVIFESKSSLPTTQRQAPSFEAPLLYLFWALGRDESTWIERAVDELNFAIDNASLWTGFLGLHGGLCGLGWIAQYVSQALPEGGEVHPTDSSGMHGFEDPNIEIDDLMLKALKRPQWPDAYDAVGGLVGFGVYFLERLPRETAIHALTLIVNHLAALSERTSNGISWHSGPEFLAPSMRAQCPDGYYNLGAAHGIAGVIYLLAELSAAGIEPEKSGVLLEGAVDWLLAHQRPPGSASRFSSWIAPGYSFDTRPAWCYGDLGIMAVLTQAARRTGRRDWNEFAQDLLDHCLAWPVRLRGVEEAGLCHGACGVAHVFNRLYHSEGDPRCKEASLKWLELAVGMWRPGTGVGGFVALTRPSSADHGSDANREFLHGSVGVGLALLAALTPVVPEWDRLLLLSGRNWRERDLGKRGGSLRSDLSRVERRAP